MGRGRRVHGGELGAAVRVGVGGSSRRVVLRLLLATPGGGATRLRPDQTVSRAHRVSAGQRRVAQSLRHVIVAILRGQVVAGMAMAPVAAASRRRGRAGRRGVRVTVAGGVAAVRAARLVVVPRYMVAPAAVRHSLVVASRQ